MTQIHIYTNTYTLDTASDCRKRGNCSAHSLLLCLEVSFLCSVFQSCRKMRREQAELPGFYYGIYTTCPTSYTGCALVNSVVGSVIYLSYIMADSNKWTLLCWDVELGMGLGREAAVLILRLLVVACSRTHQPQHHLRSSERSPTD